MHLILNKLAKLPFKDGLVFLFEVGGRGGVSFMAALWVSEKSLIQPNECNRLATGFQKNSVNLSKFPLKKESPWTFMM